MGFSFSDLFGKITAVSGAGSGESVLGIDIGASSIKVVQLRNSHGAAVLETYGEIALAPYAKQPVGKAIKLTPEQLAKAITDLVKEANVTSNKAGVSIPFSASLVTVIDLPQVGEDQLKRMVPIEARKYIPVPVSEVALDWFVIPKDTESDTFDHLETAQTAHPKGEEVLLVAVHNDILRSYQEIMQNASISASFYEVEIFSAVRSSLGHGLAPVMIVDIGASTTKMYVVERGVVRLTHLLTVGGQHMSEYLARAMTWEFDKAERIKRERGLVDSGAFSTDENDRIKSALLSTLTRVFTEVDRVLLSYGQRYNKNISHVVFAGGGASLPGLLDTAQASLNAEVEIAQPFSRTEAPAFLADALRQIGPGFAVAVGLALRKLKRG
ncbi:type IV pilus assembly protein PilM [bacterium]|nr:type IV pilus assembly protein PilM [bacterium]